MESPALVLGTAGTAPATSSRADATDTLAGRRPADRPLSRTPRTTGATHAVAAGSDRLLIFMTALENEPDLAVSSVTWGGQALARIDGTAATAGAFAGRVELWYLDEAGISAATGNTFAVTYGGTGPADAHHAAVTCESVEQGGPVLDSAASASPDGSVNPIEASVGAVAGGMTVAAAISGNTGSFDWGNGFSEGTDQNQASSDSSTADRSSATDGTETASATHSGPNRLAVVAASLTPSRVCADADGDDVCDGSRDQASCSRNSPTSLT